MSTVPVWRHGRLQFFPRYRTKGGIFSMPRNKSVTSLLVDRIVDAAMANAGSTVDQHDIEIPEGYLAEIWGFGAECSGLLDTGGVYEAYLSLDEDVITFTTARTSDDVIAAIQWETLLVTTGAAMVAGAYHVFFPDPILTAQSIINWIGYTATDWSSAVASYCLYYKLRKASKEDIVELLLRRR